MHGLRITISGNVQGLGVRPSIARLASEIDLRGSVVNTAEGVHVELFGPALSISRFVDLLPRRLPTAAAIDQLQTQAIPLKNCQGFTILQRESVGVTIASVPVDRAVCTSCLTEIHDANDRRLGYSFTSCTNCGPRYSIIRQMPFDRSETSMSFFAGCEKCSNEYRLPSDRRYHAQTNACPNCGPQLWSVDRQGKLLGANSDAIRFAAEALVDGRIVAMKGLGGYQFVVDATSPSAVLRLRNLKGRPRKPLAVMVRSLEEAENIAALSFEEQRQLASSAAPIVIVRRRNDGKLAHEVSPELPTCGLMLPTTPLHALLLDRVARPLVVTSGNLEGGVLEFDEHTASQELSNVADVWLHHDRQIERPIDDSVVRVIGGQAAVYRLGRGLAPLRLPALESDRPIIALGGQQKNAIAIFNGSQVVLGPHVGDLQDAAVGARWHQQFAALTTLYGVSAGDATIVGDAHPDYFTGRMYPKAMRVYHHHAHVAAVMHEHGLHGQVLGLAWDGTGYGVDGTIWGSEALLATRYRFHRVAFLRPFALVGGDLATGQPWRVATELVVASLGIDATSALPWPLDRTFMQLLSRRHLHAICSSMGRLFDAVAALALGIMQSSEEGWPAIQLEFAADVQATGEYSIDWNRETGEGDWRPLIRQVVLDVRTGTDPGAIAMRFHAALANWAAEIARYYSHLPMVISGGCFQNALLRQLLDQRLATRDAGYFIPTMVPPGDGGLAVGQLAVAAAQRKHDVLGDPRKNRPVA